MSVIKNKEGNFYPVAIEGTDWHCDWLFSTHRGCPFDCVYCSSKRLNVRFGGDPCEIRRLKGAYIEKWITGNFEVKEVSFLGGIFVSPYNDIMTIKRMDVIKILEFCMGKKATDSNFIFQTKDPAKYFDYLDWIPNGSWLGTTIETNKVTLDYKEISKAPAPFIRVDYMRVLHENHKEFKYFVTIEPILRFTETFMYYIDDIKPDLVFIGANTSKINLPEPSADELMALIDALRKITVVHLKSNLKRLLPSSLHGWFQEVKKM